MLVVCWQSSLQWCITNDVRSCRYTVVVVQQSIAIIRYLFARLTPLQRDRSIVCSTHSLHVLPVLRLYVYHRVLSPSRSCMFLYSSCAMPRPLTVIYSELFLHPDISVNKCLRELDFKTNAVPKIAFWNTNHGTCAFTTILQTENSFGLKSIRFIIIIIITFYFVLFRKHLCACSTSTPPVADP